MDLKIDFTDKEISPWSGVYLLKKMLDRMEFDEILSALNYQKLDQIEGITPINYSCNLLPVFGVVQISLSIQK